MACTPPGCKREQSERSRTPGVAPPVNLHCPFGALGQGYQGVPYFLATLSPSATLRINSAKSLVFARNEELLRFAQNDNTDAQAGLLGTLSIASPTSDQSHYYPAGSPWP